MSQFVILQSGFISPPLTGLIHSTPPEESALKSIVKKENPFSAQFAYMPEWDQLFQAFVADHRELTKFTYRESLMALWVGSFSTSYPFMKTWTDLQNRSTHLTNSHAQFLVDTYEYIQSGHRRIDRQSWRALIIASSRNVPVYAPHIQNDQSMLDILARLVSHPDGYIDLLYTGKIIFGQAGDRSS